MSLVLCVPKTCTIPSLKATVKSNGGAVIEGDMVGETARFSIDQDPNEVTLYTKVLTLNYISIVTSSEYMKI